MWMVVDRDTGVLVCSVYYVNKEILKVYDVWICVIYILCMCLYLDLPLATRQIGSGHAGGYIAEDPS